MVQYQVLIVMAALVPACDGGDEVLTDAPATADAAQVDAAVSDAAVPDAGAQDAGGPPDASSGITIIVAGAGAGVVDVVDPIGVPIGCLAPQCFVPAPAGGTYELVAVAASSFGGWSGACTSATGPCTIDLAEGASATVTATFEAEPGEVAAYLTPAAGFAVVAVGIRPDGGVIVTDGTAITSRAPDGTIDWTTSLPAPGPIQGFDTDSAGRAFVLVGAAGNTLHAVAPAGAVAWSQAIAGAEVAYQAFGDMVEVTGDGGAIVAWNGGGQSSVRRYDALGAAAWTVPAQPFAYGVAIAPGGPIYLAVESTVDPDTSQTVDISLTGAVLASSYPIPGYYDVVIETDAGGAVVASSAGHGNVRVSRQGGFDVNESGLASGALEHGVAVDSTGAVVAARAVDKDDVFSGVVFHRRDATGTLLASFTHAPSLTAFGTVGVSIRWIAAGSGGRVALAGNLASLSGAYDLVQVFDFVP
jgi:hypothetical protein